MEKRLYRKGDIVNLKAPGADSVLLQVRENQKAGEQVLQTHLLIAPVEASLVTGAVHISEVELFREVVAPLDTEALIEQLLNALCLTVQESLRIDDGFNASMYFSDERGEQFREIVRDYINYELANR